MALGDSFAEEIVEKYRSFVAEEKSLKVKYETLSYESDERQLECQKLKEELSVIQQNCANMPFLTSTQRTDYEFLLQKAHEKTVSGRIADSKDQLAVDIYLNLKTLAKKTLQDIEFVHRKGESGEVMRLVPAFAMLIGQQFNSKGSLKHKTMLENTALKQQQVASALNIEVNFLPGQPLSREVMLKELKRQGKETERDLETLVDEYKSREILNYFTDMEAIQTQTGPFFLQMVEKAYSNFRSFTNTLFQAHSRLFTALQTSISANCLPSASLSAEFPGHFTTFPALSPRQESTDPSDSPQDLQTDSAETLYLEQSRLKARTAWPRPAFRKKVRAKRSRFEQFLSRGTSPKTHLMHNFWSELRQSTQKIESLRAQESFFMTEISGKRLNLQKIRSLPTSPKTVRPFPRLQS